MGRQLHAYLAPTALPDAATLQRALDALQLGLELRGAWPPAGPTAELPLSLYGQDACVQVDLQAAPHWPEGVPCEVDVATLELMLALRWSGGPREHLAALALAAALAEGAQAQVLEPECRLAVGPSALQTVAREIRDEQL
ncbi:hypothetical protein KAK07_21190 [Ideonella sp. 4Y16]|uniref:hypothetical protein n=1 Tax=Ideonella alba TaxID=2824118 RepID=UPI001B38B54D|nr:hypothetical protein [Ideonella alba]MBQ0945870.1 hypothetical protein [Ideonella alba]